MMTISCVATSLSLLTLSFENNLMGCLSHFDMQSTMSLSALLFVAWSAMIKGAAGSAEEHIELGKKMLAAGQLSDALSHYHAAIEADPNNYMAYYSRATVYLAMKKSKSALPDLDRVIQLKPDFISARSQRAGVKLKQGNLDEAKADYLDLLKRDPSNADAKRHIEDINPLKQEIEMAWKLFEDGEYNIVVNLLTHAIEACPMDPSLRELRAECYIALGEPYKAIHDIRPTVKLTPDNTKGYFKLSKLYYEQGEAEDSLNEIRECLKLDPDHKDCFPHYKLVKKLVKQMESVQKFINEELWDDCVSKADTMLKTESHVWPFVFKAKSHKCHCHSRGQNVKEALDACNDVLEMDENNIDALCYRAEARIINEQFEEAIKDFQTAESVSGDETPKKVQEGVKKAQKLLKQSQKRDYYKILGVRRNAKKRDIVKAYRKLAAEWHPDKYSGTDKEKAEKKFIDLAAAKEVLINPEKRRQFDQGIDPLDPEEQANQGGHHHGGFNPFGGGQGGNYHFKFNFG